MFSYLINVILLNFIMLILVHMKMNSVFSLSSSFNSLFFFMISMVFVNMIVMFTEDMKVCLSLLLFLSFLSMFLVLNGYGLSLKVFIMVLIKSFSDLFMFMMMMSLFFLEGNSYHFLSLINTKEVEYCFIFISLVYSLIGLAGFWMYWAMDASYFVSSYMHACGFMSMGVVFMNKLVFLGVLNPNLMFYKMVSFTSMFFYFMFVMLFMVVKDPKKSFGFYSSSSICFLFFTSMNFPIYGLMYFFLSSLMKVLVFEVLFYTSSINLFKWVLMFLFSLSIINNSFIFMILGDMNLIFMIITLKYFSILLFFYKLILYKEETFNNYKINFLLNLYMLKSNSLMKFKFLSLWFNISSLLMMGLFYLLNKMSLFVIYFKLNMSFFSSIFLLLEKEVFYFIKNINFFLMSFNNFYFYKDNNLFFMDMMFLVLLLMLL